MFALKAQTEIAYCSDVSFPARADIQTLCEQNENFVPDIVVGLHTNSVTFASSLAGTPNWFGTSFYFNKKIEINGKLILNKSLGLVGSRLKMGPSAEIISIGNNRLYASGSHFFACEHMWEGLTGQNGGKFQLTNCQIEDAENAISAEDETILSLRNNTFNRNTVGIRNTNAAATTTGLTIDYLNGNLFTSNSELNDGTPQSYAGILLRNCVADIGSFNWTNNFRYMTYGIHSKESVLMITGCHFQDMVYDQEGGVGIYAEDGTVVVKGHYIPTLEDILGGSTFVNCAYAGILVKGTNLNVENAYFGGSQEFGVQSLDNHNLEHIKIQDNVIEMDMPECLIGISLERSIAWGNLYHNEIVNNKITMSEGLRGIDVYSNFPAIDKMRIELNFVLFTEAFSNQAGQGIAILGGEADEFHVLVNAIQYLCLSPANPNGTNRWGIYMFSATGLGHNMTENIITGTSNRTTYAGHCGIHLENAKNVYACINETVGTVRGIHINGDCDHAHFASNYMDQNAYGLRINDFGNSSGAMSTQVRRGNKFGPFAGGQFGVWAAECLSDPLESRFLIENNHPSIYPPLRTPVGDEWFKVEQGLKEHCEGAHLTAKYSSAETKTLEGQYGGAGAIPSGVWDSKRKLYARQLRKPELLQNNSNGATFHYANINESFSKQARVAKLFSEALLADPAIADSLNVVYEAQLAALQQLSMFNMLRDTMAADSVFDYLRPLKRAVITDLVLLKATEETQKTSIATMRQPLFVQLQQEIDSLSINTAYEEARQTVMDYKLKLLRGLNTTSDYEEILELVHKDVGEYGTAVLEAKGLLPFCEIQNLFIEDGASSSPIPLQEGNTLEEIFTMKVYPNPVSLSARIQFNQAVSGTITVFDMTGKEMQTLRVEDEWMADFSAAAWPAGVYLLHLEKADGYTEQQKIVIE